MSVLREASQRSLEMHPNLGSKYLRVTFICVLFGTFSRNGVEYEPYWLEAERLCWASVWEVSSLIFLELTIFTRDNPCGKEEAGSM